MLEPADSNPWQLRERREVYRNPWTVLHEDRISDPSGREGVYGWLAPRDHAIVCPLHADGSVTLVRQWRWAWNRSSWELPCGACDGDPALVAAQRELTEEAGLHAAAWTALGVFHNSDARVGGQGHAFLARDLAPTPTRRESSEADMVCARVPLAEALAACDDGRITAISTLWLLLRVAALDRPG